MNCRWNVSSCQLPAARCRLKIFNFQFSVLRSKLATQNLALATRNSKLGTRNFLLSTQHSVLIALLLLVLAACQGAPAVPEAPTLAVLEVKLLATVYISPTPNADEMQATQRAFTPTPSPVPVLPSPTPTPYVGVFLGEVEADVGPDIGLELLRVPPTPDRFATQVPTCTTSPDPAFGESWSADSVPRRLGCPIQIAAPFRGVSQVFERGVMYWRGDTGEIWAIATSGPSAGQYWYLPQSGEAMNEDITPPGGLRVPVRGFGGVWRNQAGVRDALGFARTDEEEHAMQSQRFDGGLLFLDSSAALVFALIVDGTAFGPFPA